MIISEESLRFSENCIKFFDSSFILKNTRDRSFSENDWSVRKEMGGVSSIFFALIHC